MSSWSSNLWLASSFALNVIILIYSKYLLISHLFHDLIVLLLVESFLIGKLNLGSSVRVILVKSDTAMNEQTDLVHIEASVGFNINFDLSEELRDWRLFLVRS